ncbi:hypothetical protein GF337_17040 [candidate division KSB1 bacterium]|nr:hypothetical protein [candidate division KSB1 bacterium]
MIFKKLSGPKRIIAISSTFVIGFLLFGYLSAEYTSRPKFCTTCHYMQPFYDSWASSTHNDVPCTKCHYSPGFKSVIETKTVGLVHLVTYVTQFYKRSKPAAEISDASCLRSECHDTRLLSGKEKFNRVYFDHAPHLTEMRRKKKLRCTSCHSQIVQGDHMKVTESTCFLCHFKTGPNDPHIHDCIFCHDAPTRENSAGEVLYDHSRVVDEKIACERCHTEMIIGDGAVALENCYNCHWEQDRLSRINEIDFMHQMHITDHKIECQHCHSPIQHKLPEKEELHLLDCSGCHVDPHKAQIEMFTGSGGFGSQTVPNPMFKHSITCKGCHVFHNVEMDLALGGDTYTANKKSCENCHGEGFAKLLDQWRQASQEKLNSLEKDYQRAYNEINRLKSQNTLTAKRLLREAKYNIDLVDIGKSVHNVQFADELLRSAHEKLRQALNTAGSKISLRPYPKTSDAVPAECNTCHYGIEIQKKLIFGMEFSHKNHVVDRMQTCKVCHSNDRKHGELIMTKSKCANCHHDEDTEDCSGCHQFQKKVYMGNLENFKIAPDIMAEAGVECISCHLYTDRSILPTVESCRECHDDESYINAYAEWQEETTTVIEFIENWLQENRSIKLTEEQNEKISKVKEAVQIVKKDGSRGVHNPQFFLSLLEKSQNTLSQIK